MGHKEIMAFIDPGMSKSYYYNKVLPRIKDVILQRGFAGWGKAKVITYKTLLLARLLEIKVL